MEGALGWFRNQNWCSNSLRLLETTPQESLNENTVLGKSACTSEPQENGIFHG